MDAQETPNTQPDNGKGKGTTEKANWDPIAKKLFLDLYVEMVHKNNRINGHFNRFAHEYVRTVFNQRLGRNYGSKKFRNFLDSLKKEWTTFEYLRKMESGVDWSFKDGTITASSEWWMDKIKRVPSAAKYMKKGLEYYNEMEIIFRDTAATGEFAWSPNSGRVPSPNRNPSPGSPISPVFMEEYGSTPDSLDELEPDYNNNNNETEGNRKRRREESSSGGGFGKRRLSAATRISKSLNKVVDAFQSSLFTSRNTAKDEMNQCLDILGRLPGIVVGSPEYAAGARSFVNADFRTLFLSLPIDEVRVTIIQQEKSRFYRDI